MQSILIDILFGALILLVLLLAVLVFNFVRTTAHINKTVKVLSSDVDVLMHQADNLMTKANTLVEDINGKVATIDPLFAAVADLSESVSAVNETGRNFASLFTRKKAKQLKQKSIIKVGRTAAGVFKKKGME
ncbi:MAG: DUF948 domain-containing protein [Streptococcaceae bacterium]|jgi:uncharacterized protein YoxC|nr:DUF948 domain-containing protein [Streptococcaceae bacterium]